MKTSAKQTEVSITSQVHSNPPRRSSKSKDIYEFNVSEDDLPETIQPATTPKSSDHNPQSSQSSSKSKRWTAQDDIALKNARRRGLSFALIAQDYFPGRTADGCKKRYARLKIPVEDASGTNRQERLRRTPPPESANSNTANNRSPVKRDLLASHSAVNKHDQPKDVNLPSPPTTYDEPHNGRDDLSAADEVLSEDEDGDSGNPTELDHTSLGWVEATNEADDPTDDGSALTHNAKHTRYQRRAAKNAEKKNDKITKRTSKVANEAKRKRDSNERIQKLQSKLKAEEEQKKKDEEFQRQVRKAEAEQRRIADDPRSDPAERERARAGSAIQQLIQERILRSSRTPASSANPRRSVSFNRDASYLDSVHVPSPRGTNIPRSILKSGSRSQSELSGASHAANRVGYSSPFLTNDPPTSAQRKRKLMADVDEIQTTRASQLLAEQQQSNVSRRLFLGVPNSSLSSPRQTTLPFIRDKGKGPASDINGARIENAAGPHKLTPSMHSRGEASSQNSTIRKRLGSRTVHLTKAPAETRNTPVQSQGSTPADSILITSDGESSSEEEPLVATWTQKNGQKQPEVRPVEEKQEQLRSGLISGKRQALNPTADDDERSEIVDDSDYVEERPVGHSPRTSQQEDVDNSQDDVLPAHNVPSHEPDSDEDSLAKMKHTGFEELGRLHPTDAANDGFGNAVPCADGAAADGQDADIIHRPRNISTSASAKADAARHTLHMSLNGIGPAFDDLPQHDSSSSSVESMRSSPPEAPTPIYRAPAAQTTSNMSQATVKQARRSLTGHKNLNELLAESALRPDLEDVGTDNQKVRISQRENITSRSATDEKDSPTSSSSDEETTSSSSSGEDTGGGRLAGHRGSAEQKKRRGGGNVYASAIKSINRQMARRRRGGRR